MFWAGVAVCRLEFGMGIRRVRVAAFYFDPPGADLHEIRSRVAGGLPILTLKSATRGFAREA